MSSPSESPSPPSSSDPEQDESAARQEHLFRSFVGDNYAYYAKAWARIDQKKSNFWNWAAFFLGIGWVAYRKMYLYASILFAVVLIEAICQFTFVFPNLLSLAINIGITVTYSLMGNRWYRSHVMKMVEKLQQNIESEEVLQQLLAREGGTSVASGIGFAIALFVAGMTVVVLFDKPHSPTPTGWHLQ